jgi:hypothetical protein
MRLKAAWVVAVPLRRRTEATEANFMVYYVIRIREDFHLDLFARQRLVASEEDSKGSA